MLPATGVDAVITKLALHFTTVTLRQPTPVGQFYLALVSAALACLLPQQSTSYLCCCSNHCSIVQGGPSQVVPAATVVRRASPHPLNFADDKLLKGWKCIGK